jgi:RNA polymerase sigma factor (sigma-70 family)
MRTDDGYIIHRCLNGDPEAFGILVDRYKEGIYAYVRNKLHDWHDAQDVSQEVFIQAYRKLHTLRKWDSFSGWLFRIASNHCKNWQLSKSRRPDSEFTEDQDPAILDKPSVESHHNNLMIESVHEALNSLPETYREVLTLYYFGNMDSNKIAETLSVSPVAIRHRLSRARAQLKEEIFTMMSATFQQEKLKAGFTFRVVEAIRRIKIHPMSQTKGVPWGLSLAAGIIITVLSLNPQLNPVNILGSFGGSWLPSESKVLKAGEIPVDMTKVSKMSFLSSQQGDGNSNEPYFKQNALFMAPKANIGEWVMKADMPTERCQFSGAVVNGKIYAIGGGTIVNGVSTYFSTVEEYDPINDKWIKKADMPTEELNENGAIAINGLIYFIGGWDNNGATSTVSVYDPSKDTWTKKSDMSTARSAYYAGVVNGKIYVIGGGNSVNVLSAIEEYDPATDTWTKKSDMPTAKAWFDGAVVNDKIYIFGGDSTNGADWGPPLPVVEEYNPATDTWTRKSDLPTPRLALSTVAVDGKIYVIGGFKGPTVYPFIEIYDPSNNTWSKGEDMQVPICQAFGCAFDGKIYIIGGFDGVKALSIVQEYDTGFRPSSIESKGKLSTTWGNRKK